MRTSKDGAIVYTKKELCKMMKKIAKELGHTSAKAALEYNDKEDPSELGYAQLECYRWLLTGGSPEYKKMRKEEKKKKNKVKIGYHTFSHGDTISIAFDEYDEKDLFWEWFHEFGIDAFEEFKNEGK